MNPRLKFVPLSPLGLGISLGLIWAIATLLTGWLAIFGWCINLVEAFSSVYMGYKPSFLGGIIGAIWGFFHGLIKGLLIGYFYNLVTQKFSGPY